MGVRIEKQGPVWTIIHSRAEARNAMDTRSADEIYAAFTEFDRASDASVAVFWGEGGTFCAGWDLKLASTLTKKEDFERDMKHKFAFPSGATGSTHSSPPRGPMGPTRMELSKPVIAAIEGAAVAGGMEIALWCDCRVMAEDAYFGVYCRRWGVPLIDGGTVRLPRLVGQGRALDLILTGRRVDAVEAERIGLCERVTPKGQARAKAEEMAQEIARFPQGTMRADRLNVYETYGKSTRDGLQTEWNNSVDQVFDEGVQGATRFSKGRGRSGDFKDI